MAGPVRIAILGNATSAVSSLNKTAAATTTLGTRMKTATLAAAKFAAIGLGVGVAAAGYAAVKFAKAAAEDQQAASLMAKSFRNAAGATSEQIAATEKWISAQGAALGVTDDELRPALSKLVTVTGDVNKAQSLASLAMDVSAGSGKSLQTVTDALVRAQNGSVGGLSRLGIATKNAAGETLSLSQITDNMAKKFGGAAKTKANTFQGQLDRLKLIASEAAESLGAKLIPILTRFASFMLSTGIPAITKFGKAAKEQLGNAFDTVRPVLEKVGSILRDQVLPAALKVFNFLRDNKPVVIAFAAVLGVGAAALVVLGAAMAVVNAVMLANPITLVVLALAGLAAGLTYAYTKSETFRAIVDAAWAGIKKATQAVFPVVQKVVSVAFDVLKKVFFNFTGPGLLIKHWDRIKSVTQTTWAVVKSLVVGAINGVKSAINGIKSAVTFVTNAWSTVKEGTRAAWQRVVEIIGEKITAFMTKVNNIKTKVTDAFIGAGTWLYEAGKAILQGLLDGLDALWQKLKDKAQDIANLLSKLPGVGKLVSGKSSLRVVTGEALGRSGSSSSELKATITLTADHIDQLSRGRSIRADLDAWDSVGGRRVAVA